VSEWKGFFNKYFFLLKTPQNSFFFLIFNIQPDDDVVVVDAQPGGEAHLGNATKVLEEQK
jgi:hypothetical protein